MARVQVHALSRLDDICFNKTNVRYLAQLDFFLCKMSQSYIYVLLSYQFHGNDYARVY